MIVIATIWILKRKTTLTLVLRNYPESVVLESSVKPSQWCQSRSIGYVWQSFGRFG